MFNAIRLGWNRNLFARRRRIKKIEEHVIERRQLIAQHICKFDFLKVGDFMSKEVLHILIILSTFSMHTAV